MGQENIDDMNVGTEESVRKIWTINVGKGSDEDKKISLKDDMTERRNDTKKKVKLTKEKICLKKLRLDP